MVGRRKPSGMNDPIPTALQLLDRHLATLTTHPDAWYALFADDAVIEFPYATGTPFPPQLEGKSAIVAHYAQALQWFEPFTFRDVRFHAAGSELASCEVHGSSKMRATGEPYEQDYVLVVEACDGRIVRYREYWNPIPSLNAVTP